MVMRHLVQALAKQGKTILYSSHVLEIVERLCSKVIVLHRGKAEPATQWLGLSG